MKQASIFEAAGAAAKIDSGLNQTILSEFNQVEIFQIPDQHWSSIFRSELIFGYIEIQKFAMNKISLQITHGQVLKIMELEFN